MSRNTYSAGNVFFPGLDCKKRLSEGNGGNILIGGDRGDVEAVSARIITSHRGSGVLLEDAFFLTTLDLERSEVEDEVREVVQACYDSIQEETFTQST